MAKWPAGYAAHYWFLPPVLSLVGADVVMIGGTGRFASATGSGKMTGGFTGEVPVGDFFISIDGTLNTR